MILKVRHETRCAYASQVSLAAYVLHLRPRDLPWQQILSFTLQVSHESSRVTEAEDHFGNSVAWLFLDSPHETLWITAETVLEVLPHGHPDPASTPAWEHLVRLAQQREAAHAIAEFAFGTALAPAEANVWAASSFPPGRPVLAGLLDLMERLAPVLQGRTGAAHLMLAALRGLGLPARYVSGYRQDGPHAAHLHTWIACWLGPEHGWISVDPVNNRLTGDEHVWLGWGRDHADVNPVRGVVQGGGQPTLRASVDIWPATAPQG